LAAGPGRRERRQTQFQCPCDCRVNDEIGPRPWGFDRYFQYKRKGRFSRFQTGAAPVSQPKIKPNQVNEGAESEAGIADPGRGFQPGRGRDHRSRLQPEKIESDGNNKNEDRGDPPNRLDPRRSDFGRKLTLEEIVIIKIVVRQIEAVIARGLFAPTRIMIRAAFRTGERPARNVFAADGAGFRSFGAGLGHDGVKRRELYFPTKMAGASPLGRFRK